MVSGAMNETLQEYAQAEERGNVPGWVLETTRHAGMNRLTGLRDGFGFCVEDMIAEKQATLTFVNASSSEGRSRGTGKRRQG